MQPALGKRKSFMKAQLRKILIIGNETEDWSAQEQESLIGAYPFQIHIAHSLIDAREKIKLNIFHAIICDYSLNDGSCMEILSLVGGIPFIVLIEEGDEDIALLALKSGASDYLIKDSKKNYKKFVPLAFSRAVEQKMQSEELKKYRADLENIVEERTIELIDMYSKLQESEINFRNIFNSSKDGIVILDFNLEFVEANDAMLNFLGVSKDFFATHPIVNFIVPDYRPLILEKLEVVRKGFPSGMMEIELISPVNGTLVPFEVSSVPILFNQKNAILSILRDTEERKYHARKLFETIILTEEEERSRIARDLHDEIGPLISALKIYTTSFLESTNPEKEKLAAQMSTIVKDVLDSIKTISNDMSPHILVNFGILAALKNFIDLFSKNITIKLESNMHHLRFPSTVESLIYRIIKELINNTVKHAHAKHIHITLEFENATLMCHYSDDGVGFDWKQLVENPRKGMGLNNIITRIHSLGGDFEVRSEPEKGFEINFILHTTPKDATNKEETQNYYRR